MVGSAPVFQVLCFFLQDHAGFFHDPNTGRVFREGTGINAAKALPVKGLEDGRNGFRGIALSPKAGVDDPAQFHGIAADLCIVDPADQLFSEIYAQQKAVFPLCHLQKAGKQGLCARIVQVGEHIGGFYKIAAQDLQRSGFVCFAEGVQCQPRGDDRILEHSALLMA